MARLGLRAIAERIAPLAGKVEYDRGFLFDLLLAFGRSKGNITRLRNGSLNIADDPEQEVGQKNVVYFRETAQTIIPGSFFVLQGVMAFIAEVGDSEVVSLKHKDELKERFRVVFENGTESAMYRQSFAARMGEQRGFAVARTGFDVSEIGDADIETGHIYVLRSLSEHPDIRGQENLFKIGFSTTPVAQRIKGAEKSPTYLMAPVEVVADYRAYNLRPSALEHLLHKVFASARLDASVADALGGSVAATEWFLVPLPVIDHPVDLIMSGEIIEYIYNPSVQDLVRIK